MAKKKVLDKVERIKFDDGSWWDIKTVVTRGMRKRFRRAGVTAIDFHSNGSIDLDNPDAIEEYVKTHPEAVDLDAMEDAYLVEGSVAWSFFNSSVPTLDQIDELDDKHVAETLARMRELYSETTEEEVANLDEKP